MLEVTTLPTEPQPLATFPSFALVNSIDFKIGNLQFIVKDDNLLPYKWLMRLKLTISV